MKLKVTIKGGSQASRTAAYAKIADALAGHYAGGTALDAKDSGSGRKLSGKAKLDNASFGPPYGKVG